MTLDDYLKSADLTEEKFAEKLSVSQPAVHRYRKGRIPTPDVMQKIVEATAGRVTPNDFFDLPPDEPEAKAS